MLYRNLPLHAVKYLVGDNFFKSANYTIEVLCAAPFNEEKENLRNVEAQILSKRAEISKFESEYREVCTIFRIAVHMYLIIISFDQTSRWIFVGSCTIHRNDKQICTWNANGEFFYSSDPLEKNSSDGSNWSETINWFSLQIDELLKQRNEIHASYTVVPLKRSSSSSKGRSKTSSKESKEDGEVREKRSTRERPRKKKWYNLHLRVDKRKAC